MSMIKWMQTKYCRRCITSRLYRFYILAFFPEKICTENVWTSVAFIAQNLCCYYFSFSLLVAVWPASHVCPNTYLCQPQQRGWVCLYACWGMLWGDFDLIGVPQDKIMGGRSCEGNNRYGLKARLQRCSFTALSYGHKPVMKGLMLIYNFSRIALYDLQFRMVLIYLYIRTLCHSSVWNRPFWVSSL